MVHTLSLVEVDPVVGMLEEAFVPRNPRRLREARFERLKELMRMLLLGWYGRLRIVGGGRRLFIVQRLESRSRRRFVAVEIISIVVGNLFGLLYIDKTSEG